MFLSFFVFLLFISSESLNANSKKKEIRVGKHNLTLQWIESKQTGIATIQKESAGLYFIKGEQRDSLENYLTIEGKIRVISFSELHFEGEIISRISHIFEGNPCLRKGKQIFKAHGKRKYWRMQEKLNCDGVVTDYVDIFF